MARFGETLKRGLAALLVGVLSVQELAAAVLAPGLGSPAVSGLRRLPGSLPGVFPEAAAGASAAGPRAARYFRPEAPRADWTAFPRGALREARAAISRAGYRLALYARVARAWLGSAGSLLKISSAAKPAPSRKTAGPSIFARLAPRNSRADDRGASLGENPILSIQPSPASAPAMDRILVKAHRGMSLDGARPAGAAAPAARAPLARPLQRAAAKPFLKPRLKLLPDLAGFVSRGGAADGKRLARIGFTAPERWRTALQAIQAPPKVQAAPAALPIPAAEQQPQYTTLTVAEHIGRAARAVKNFGGAVRARLNRLRGGAQDPSAGQESVMVALDKGKIVKACTGIGPGETLKLSDGRSLSAAPGVQAMTHVQVTEQSGEQYIAQRSPLVFDLDGGGIRTSPRRTLFDIDADGLREWINDLSPADGVLVFDADGDGISGEDGRELFGDLSDVDGDGEADGHADGFAALEAFARRAVKDRALPTETLAARAFDAADLKTLESRYGLRMRVGGMKDRAVTLKEAGVIAIAFGQGPSKREENFDGLGNGLSRREGARFTRASGTQGDYADVWFRFERAGRAPAATGA